MKIRRCCLCNRKIILCDGRVNAGDHLRAMNGEIPFSAVREMCGFCATLDIIRDEPTFHYWGA